MNIALILSGGVGSRMGLCIPKQYVEINHHPVIWYCLKTFLSNARTDAIVIGVAEEWKLYVNKQIAELNSRKPIFYAKPGETRQY